ncbi:MAG: TraR/DksA family transcriptional regulator [Candidatus Berkelbacteria bacterium]|nr:TraR/DksA family transcriptional regulator [Candidatus Berkelbacteria bacterium]
MKLDEKFLAKQKKLLESEKKRLEKEIKDLDRYPSHEQNDEDNAMAVSDYDRSVNIEKELAKLLKKVHAAISAIEASTYGKCSRCKKAIEEGRLKSMPYADICVTCVSKKNAK